MVLFVDVVFEVNRSSMFRKTRVLSNLALHNLLYLHCSRLNEPTEAKVRKINVLHLMAKMGEKNPKVIKNYCLKIHHLTYFIDKNISHGISIHAKAQMGT